MKIQQILNKMDQDVANAYTVVEEKGGELPLNQTLENLPLSVGSIDSGSEWGTIGYYPTTIEKTATGYGVEIISIDQATLTTFLENNPPMDAGMIEFYFESGWDPETGEPDPTTGEWRYWGEEGDIRIPVSEFATTTGINCTVTEDWADITVVEDVIVDTEGEVQYADFVSREQYEAFTCPGETGEVTVGEVTIVPKAIKEVVVGNKVTAIHNAFIAYANNLVSFDMSKAKVTSIGTHFLYECHSFNQPLDLSGVFTIGNYCLCGANAFNSSITLPAIQVFPAYFMKNCSAFNQPLTLPNTVMVIGDEFMRDCGAFNQPFTIPSITALPSYFMFGWASFNQSITIPSSVRTIGAYSFSNMYVFNKALTIPSTITTINAPFFATNRNYTQTITLEAQASVITPNNSSFSTLSTSDACYATGITFAGTYGQQWFNKHLPRTTSPYRKILGYSIPENYVKNTSGEVIVIESDEYSKLCGGNSGRTINFKNGTVTSTTIKEVHLKDTSVTSLGDGFCYYFTNMTTLEIPTTVTTIGTSFCSGCKQLNSPVSFSNVTTIGRNFMWGCQVFNQPLDFSKITVFPENTLYNCRALNKPITFASAVTSIGDNFMYASCAYAQPTTINMNGSIGNYFMGQSSTSSRSAMNADLTITGNLTTLGIGFLKWAYMKNCHLTLPNTLTAIPNDFLVGVAMESSFVIPSSVTSIGDGFFNNASEFNSALTIPASVTTIGNYFLANCPKFNQGLTFPTLTSIGTGFLYGCRQFNSYIDFGQTPMTAFTADANTMANTYSSSDPLSVCGPAIKCVDFEAFHTLFPDSTSKPWRKITEYDYKGYLIAGGVRYDMLTQDDLAGICSPTIGLPDKFRNRGLYRSRSLITECHLDSSVTVVPDFLLGNCSNVTTVELSPNTTTITGRFLYGCSSFNQALTLPSGLTSIGNQFLNGCSSFNQPLSFPAGVTEIPGFFMKDCSSFNSALTFAGTIEKIYSGFMYGCTVFNQPVPYFVGAQLHHYSNTTESKYYFYNCRAFNQPLTIGNTYGTYYGYICFLVNADSYTSTVTYVGTDNHTPYYECFTGSDQNAAIVTTGFTLVDDTTNHNYANKFTTSRETGKLRTTRIDSTPTSFTAGNVQLSVGETGEVIAQTTPASSNYEYVWTSSDPSKVRITSTEIETSGSYRKIAHIEAVALGTATLTCTHVRSNTSATATVQVQGAGAYGIVTYYPSSTSWSGWGNMGESVTIDNAKWSAYVAANNIQTSSSMGDYLEVQAYYDMDWDSPDPENPDMVWRLQTTDYQDITLSNADFISQAGVTVDLQDPTQPTQVYLNGEVIVDRTASPSRAILLDNTELQTLTNSGMGSDGTATVGGVSVPVSAIASFAFGENNVTIPDYFLANIYDPRAMDPSEQPVVNIDFTDATHVTTIGDYFLQNTRANITSQTVSLPAVTSVGSYFLSNMGNDPYSITLPGFNKQVSMPNVTTIGQCFMNNLPDFNQSLSFPLLTRISHSFLQYDTSFDSTLSLPLVTVVQDFFMYGCSSFNQSLSFLSQVTYIGDGFLYNCEAFNQPITLSSSLTSIGGAFMFNCNHFNQNITIPASVTQTSYQSDGWMRYWDSMTSTVTIEFNPNSITNLNAMRNSTMTLSSQSVPAYQSGIKIGGTYASAWMTMHPDLSGGTYGPRKLVAA